MTVSIKVKPGARKEGIGMENDALVVRVTAPATEGKANEALVRLLSAALDIPKSRIAIVAGNTSRFKRVEMPDEAARKLFELAKLA
jgi:uncharacterized protein (TIGR00251 family)